MSQSKSFILISGKRSGQRGQAMTEFSIAAAFVLVPLFLMVPMMGKFLDMKASAIQASRYAAWERTAWHGNSTWAEGEKSDLEIETEIKRRFFSDTAEAALKSTDMSDAAAEIKPMWNDHSGTSMLDTSTAAQSTGQTPGSMNKVLKPIVDVLDKIGYVTGARFKLDMESQYTSTVNLKTADTPAINRLTGGASFGFVAPNFETKHVLVANGWSANGPDFVKKQTEGLAILSLFQRSPVKEVMFFVQTVAGTFVTELSTGSLKLGGEILPDYVPPDRLVAAADAKPPIAKTPSTPKDKRRTDRQKEENDPEGTGGTGEARRTQQKAEKLDADIRKTQNSIDQCKADKANEFNNVCKNKFGAFCIDYTAEGIPFVIKPAGGWGASYSSNADKSAACSTLDQQIADLQAQLNDPDMQKPKTDSDKELAKSNAALDSWNRKMAEITPAKYPDPIERRNQLEIMTQARPVDLSTDPIFLAQRAEAIKNIADIQAKIDDLKRQKNGL
jgi:hypothetical protein